MIHAFTRLAVAAPVLLLAAQTSTFAQPTPGQAPPAGSAKELPFVSPVFGDNMVLQRGKPDAIWGWSDAGDSVRVEIGERMAVQAGRHALQWRRSSRGARPHGFPAGKNRGSETVLKCVPLLLTP